MMSPSDDDRCTEVNAQIDDNRRTSSMSTPTICCVQDYQTMAKTTIYKALYEYLASGSDDEQTLHENIAAWKRWFIRPRMMRPVHHISTATTIQFHTTGTRLSLSMPLFVSPAGVHALCEPLHGECTTASVCQETGILFGLSQHSTRSIEDVAHYAPNCTKWYQAYILKDRTITLHLIQRAIKAGYQGLFLTVDSVRFGYREADARNGFDALPPPHRLVNYDMYNNNNTNQTAENMDNTGASAVADATTLESTYNSRKHKSWDQNSEQMFAQDVTWDDVRWIKEQFTSVPLVVKGIMTAEDAILAVNAGADGIMVSNHGGRQLDGCLAPIDALPEVVQALQGRRDAVPVFLDGGVRRGTDIFKALALGASAVGIGKPVFFALAVGGRKALCNVMQMLQREFETAMALSGCQTVSDITSSMVTRHPSLHNGTEHGNTSLFERAKL